MRRMRELFSLKVVGSLVVVAGLGWAIVDRLSQNSGRGTAESVEVLKPSETKTSDRRLPRKSGAPESGEAQRRVASERDSASDDDTEDSADAPVAQATSAQVESKSKPASKPFLVTAVPPQGSDVRECAAIEYRGDGPRSAAVSGGDWAEVMKSFHFAKRGIVEWIGTQSTQISPEKRETLVRQVNDLRIQRPPTQEEPDLTWRGIVTMSRDLQGEPIVRVGEGFIRLVKSHPERARFEITRAVAQVLAPCELQRLIGWAGWDSTLQCMGMKDSGSCQAGTYSESGWAVSSLLADSIAPAGCTLPAFADQKVEACAKTFKLDAEPKRSAARPLGTELGDRT